MDDTKMPFFPHRLNPDGTYDSICLKCFATIARCLTSEELNAYDVAHSCNETGKVRIGPYWAK
jgi:hypothetical protein